MSPETIVVGDDRVLGGVLDTVADALAADGRVVRRLPLASGTVEHPLSDEEAAGILGDARVLVVSSRTVVDERILRLAPRLLGVVFASIGVNSCDLDAATAARVLVSNGPTRENVESMAESQILAMLTLCYRLRDKVDAFVERDTAALGGLRRSSRMLAGRTVGFLGYGRITQAVLRRLEGWGVGDVLVHTRTEPADADLLPIDFVGLDELMRRSEILCVNAPLNPSTAGLLNASRLAMLPERALLVVQSRGGIVDETALARLLETGRLGGAAVDTFAVEPPPAGHPLRHAPGVVPTDHIIGHTAEMFASFAHTAVRAVRDLLAGTAPVDTVNEEAIHHWRGAVPTASVPHIQEEEESMGKIVRDDESGIAAVVEALRAGGVVILPTDTVYGIFGNALDPQAVERVYEIKHRDRGKPFMIHTRQEDVERWARLTPSANALIDEFWPNPFGLLLEKEELIPDEFTMGLPTVGVMTNTNHVMRGVVSAVDFPVFGTTLNYSGEDEIRRIADAAHFVELVDVAIGADHISVETKPSSIVDCSSEPPAVIRISATSLERIQEALPGVEVALERRK